VENLVVMSGCPTRDSNQAPHDRVGTEALQAPFLEFRRGGSSICM